MYLNNLIFFKVEAARQCASSPQDSLIQNKLRLAVEELREATTTAATPAIRRNLIYKLEKCAKIAASSATQCIAASSGVTPFNTNHVTQTELNVECRSMVQFIPDLISGVKGTMTQPDDTTMQLNLINASEKFLQPASSVIKAIKAVIPTITNYALSLQLNNNSQQLSLAITDLKSSASRAREVFTGLELDAAETLINNLRIEIKELINDTATIVKLLPGEDEESTSLKLFSVCQRMNFMNAQIISAAKQGNVNYTGNAARDISATLKNLVSAVRCVSITIDDFTLKQSILTITDEIMLNSLKLLDEAKIILKSQNNSNDKDNLMVTAKEISNLLEKCVSYLPGQKYINDAIEQIEKISQVLESDEFPTSVKSYQ